MAITQGIGLARDLEGGATASELSRSLFVVRTAGVRPLVRRLFELAGEASRDRVLRGVVEKAGQIIADDYRQQALRREATGNLAASVTGKTVSYPQGATRIVGPRQTGPVGNRPDARSGNHAWLVEFGTSRRRPGTRGRQTYINVHQVINRRMSATGSMNSEQFAKQSRGYYFLMGSRDERTRQGAGGRPGYSRDFAGPGQGGDGREQHPITLGPGKSIAQMPRLNLMSDTIEARGREVFGVMRNLLEQAISVRGG